MQSKDEKVRRDAKWVYEGLEGETHRLRREIGRSTVSMTLERAALPSSEKIAVGEGCVIELERYDPFGSAPFLRLLGSIYVYGGCKQHAIHRLLRAWVVVGDRQRAEEVFIEAKALADIDRALMPGDFCSLTIRRAVS